MRRIIFLLMLLSLIFAVQPVFAQGEDTNLSVADTRACALKTDGTILCWGAGDSETPPPIGTFTQISASEHACAVKTDNTVVCWGRNLSGQTDVPAGSYTQVSTGGHHTCAIKTDNTVTCWGLNQHGQSTPDAGTFTQINAGYKYTCGIKTDSTVACWGVDDILDAGQSTPPAGTFTQVSASMFHTCGVETGGAVVCWGDNSDGQLTPPDVSFTDVTVGLSHSCGIKTDGTVACWGSNSHGQLDNIPTGTFSQISAGGHQTCGVQTDGLVVCWGDNNNGIADARVELLLNAGFGINLDGNKVPDAWTTKFRSQDKLDCDGFGNFWSQCSYKFKPGVLENSRLTQVITNFEGVPASATLSTWFYYITYQTDPLKLIVKRKIYLVGETVADLEKATVTAASPDGEFAKYALATYTLPDGKEISKIKLTFINKTQLGLLEIDDVSVAYPLVITP